MSACIVLQTVKLISFNHLPRSDMNATNAEQSREGPDNGGMPGSASKRGMKRKLESKTF
jgi:hypothetical protein